jgi:hypothetical protein
MERKGWSNCKCFEKSGILKTSKMVPWKDFPETCEEIFLSSLIMVVRKIQLHSIRTHSSLTRIKRLV